MFNVVEDILKFRIVSLLSKYVNPILYVPYYVLIILYNNVILWI